MKTITENDKKYLDFLLDISEMKSFKNNVATLYKINTTILPSLHKLGYVTRGNGSYKWATERPTIETVYSVKKEIAKYSNPKKKRRKVNQDDTKNKYYSFLYWLYSMKKFVFENEALKFGASQQISTVLQDMEYIRKATNHSEWIGEKPTKDLAVEVHKKVLEIVNNARNENKIKRDSISYAENVSMTKVQYDGLCERHGEEYTKEMIEKLKNYKYSTGKKYKSDYHTILNWISRNESLTDEKAIEHLKTSKNAIYEIIKIEREKIGEMPTIETANKTIEMMCNVFDGYDVIKVLTQSGSYGIYKVKKTTLK